MGFGFVCGRRPLSHNPAQLCDIARMREEVPMLFSVSLQGGSTFVVVASDAAEVQAAVPATLHTVVTVTPVALTPLSSLAFELYDAADRVRNDAQKRGAFTDHT